FEINHLNKEYLVSVEGYYDDNKSDIIQGLEFKTNVKSSGMIGYDDGKKFRLASNGKKIVGFHEYAEKNLNSLGAYFIATSPILESGRLWDGGAFEGVRKLYLTYNKYFGWCVTFFYDDEGKTKRFQHGSPDGQEGKFEVDYPTEFITYVEGTVKTSRLLMVASLTFKTSKGRTSSTFGYPTNNKFMLESKGCCVVGFHGRSSGALEAIGAYFRPLPPLNTEKVEAKGGKGGMVWDDGSDHEGVIKIIVRGGSKGIQYIKFDYIKNGQHIYGSDHGVMGRGFTEVFEINHLNKEYLVSVEGYYDDSKSEIIQGIEFKTNIKTSGMIGYDDGRKFILASNGKKIVGFHGYAEKYVNSLGAYFTTTSPIIKLETIGSKRPEITLWDDGAFEGIRKVCLTYKEYVWRVTFYYDDEGKTKMLQHGSPDGQEGKFELDYPNEYITSVEGTLLRESFPIISSLTFKTSKGRTSSTFGNPTNMKFSLESKGCGIVGFHGRSSGALEAIGAYFRPLLPPNMEKIEAKGGDGGNSWDDGAFDGVRKIYVGLRDKVVSVVKFMYYKEEHTVFGDDHGNNKLLFEAKEFDLNYPIEYVTSVEGSYDNISGYMTMLRFKTNKQTSPDFGVASTSSFTLQKDDHMIIGFHGKSSNILHQIGVHVRPI
ncbi:unnamed protein product, partial [Cochlearia groenlandica]